MLLLRSVSPCRNLPKNIRFCTSLSHLTSSDNVSETLDHLRRKPKTAFFLITHLKESGFKHNLTTSMAVIRLFCYWGMIKRLKFFFLDAIEDKSFHLSDFLKELHDEISHKNPWVVIAVDGLLKALISLKEFDKAYEIVVWRSTWPSILTCNLFLNVLVEEGKLGMAMKVYLHLKTNGFIGNVYTYAIVVKGLCKRGYVKEAGNVIESMRKDGVEPDSFTFGTYVHGLCSNRYTDSASELLKSLDRESPFVTDVFAYSCIVRGFVRERRLRDAEDVFFEMRKAGIVADVYCYGALIEGFCRNGEIAKALDLHDEMRSKGIGTNCVITSSIMKCLCNLGLWSEAVYRFVDAIESGVVELDGISFNIAIDALCKLGKTGKARLLLREMKNRKGMRPPDVQHYTTLIHGFCLRKDLDIALEVFDEMVNETGLEPDIVTFNVLVGGFAKRGLVDETAVLLDEMASRGIPPTDATHNIVIRGICKAGKANEAWAFFDGLETKSQSNYVALIEGCCETNNVDGAYRVFLELLREGKAGILIAEKPGSCCLKRLIRCLYEERDTERASTVFKTIISASDYEDENDNHGTMMMYSQIQSSYCEDGHINWARWVFDTMIKNGLRPDLISYTIMLCGYLRARRVTEAYRLLRDMIDDGIKPDLILCTVLLDHYSKSNNPEDVERLLEKMRLNEGLNPDVIAYTCLMLCYYCKAELEMAESVYDEMISEGLRPDLYADLAIHMAKTAKVVLRKHPRHIRGLTREPLYVLSRQLTREDIRGCSIFLSPCAVEWHLINSGLYY